MSASGYSRDGELAVVTLNRPELNNCFDQATVVALAAAFDKLAGDGNIKACIFTGAGASFSAGVDLSSPPSPAEQAGGNDAHNPVVQMGRCKFPIIGAVNGPAVTGGFELALACDILVASTKARFRDTHCRFGVAPCWGLSQKLARMVGAQRASYASYTSEWIDAPTALSWGLVASVVPPDALMAAAHKVAEGVLRQDGDTVFHFKKVLQGGLQLSLRDGLEMERGEANRFYGFMDLDGISGTWQSKL